MPKLVAPSQSRVTSIVEFAADKRVEAVRAQSATLVPVLEELLDLARNGDLTGILFLAETRGGRQHAGAHGSLLDDPSSLALASARLWRRTAEHLETQM